MNRLYDQFQRTSVVHVRRTVVISLSFVESMKARWGLAEHHSLDPDSVPSASELARRVMDLLGPNRPQAGVIRGQYVEASLLVNYLAAVQGWTIDRILNGPEDPAELVAAMKAWAARAALTGHNLARAGPEPLCDRLLVPSLGRV